MKKLTQFLALLGLSLGGLAYYFYPDRYPLYPKSDHYSPDTQRFFNPNPEKAVSSGEIMQALWKMIFHGQDFMPPAPLPMKTPDFETFLHDADNANFIWFGHSSLLARMGGQTIFIDPVFATSASPIPIMMKRFQAPPAELSQLPAVDWIVLSHNHYDHLDKAVIDFYRSQKTGFIVPLGVEVLLQKWGIEAQRIQELDRWQSTQLGSVTLSAVPAFHNTGRGLFDSNKTLWAGYVFQTPAEQIYYSGDSAFGDGSHFSQIAERFGHFDLAFIENGQYNLAWIDSHMLPEQTVEAVKRIAPTRFMPIHWGAYGLSIHPWDESVKRSMALLESKSQSPLTHQISPLTPMLGEVFNRFTQTQFWWQEVK